MSKSSLMLAAAIAMSVVSPIAQAAETPARIVEIAAERGDLRVAFADGRILRGEDLKGATISIAGLKDLKVADVQVDPTDKQHEIRLFELLRQDEAGEWRSICNKAYDGRTSALVMGDPRDPTRITITCAAGNYGKCARFGYAPWRQAPDGRPMELWHQACLKMLPAEYGGNGVPHTVNGMKIDIFDFIGINTPDSEDEMPFEAGWTPNGAVCVAHARVPKVATLADVAAAFPALPTGSEHCTQEAARAAGALVLNRSLIQ
ncbi:hypothetical protein FQV39_20790 [Bosea sp. F3-2]|uniref:ADYC domain-containing protein n=1 Tax=Bosea sp. F3-2 TaxID=2599640 RepID=UPI0011EBA933|nr:ADYC domain-containing protein [Bosea sp. F3-2]QEL24753.1 hypothetical protein FQV39_20790 [Bosea sp. F3-2]